LSSRNFHLPDQLWSERQFSIRQQALQLPKQALEATLADYGTCQSFCGVRRKRESHCKHREPLSSALPKHDYTVCVGPLAVVCHTPAVGSLSEVLRIDQHQDGFEREIIALFKRQNRCARLFHHGLVE
jgi:hypothetical protein